MTAEQYDVVIIGGGAAGFFGAISIAEGCKGKRVVILEKSSKLLAKVKVSGGGRCNVTHHAFTPAALASHYPRGHRQLKKIFHQFHVQHTVDWFLARGVHLKTEEDGRMFPTTNDSQTIIDCFLGEARRLNIQIKTQCEVEAMAKRSEGFHIHTSQGNFTCTCVLVAIGGHPNRSAYHWLCDLGLSIAPPIPSLFTFNDPSKKFSSLMGVAVPHALVRITSTKFSQGGPLLITHWGLSGPAVIKLSAWAAEYLHEVEYTFTALVNWTGLSEQVVRDTLRLTKQTHNKKLVTNANPFHLPTRLWNHLCQMTGVENDLILANVSERLMNKLVENIFACPFQIKGKTTYKEEFVTCGGVNLAEVNVETMECSKIPGLYFAGEVLHIDGETGGFNFQAAWSTAYVAALGINSKCKSQGSYREVEP